MNMKSFLALLSILALAGSMHIYAADPIDVELDRFYKAQDKANQEFNEDLQKERDRAVRNILITIKREIKKAEPSVIDELYTLVLELDRQNEEARAYFTEKGSLDKIIAKLEKKTGILIGDGKTNVSAVNIDMPRIDMTGAKEIRITSAFGTGYTLGNHRAGTTLIFQYVSGKWSGDNEKGDNAKNQSPDDANSSEGNRVQLYIDSGNDMKVLTLIPPGTADKPFIYTLTEDIIGLSVRIANRDGIKKGRGGRQNAGGGGGNPNDFSSAYTGDVKYLVRIVRQ